MRPARVGTALVAALLLSCAAHDPRPAWELPPAPPNDSPVVQPDRLHRAELDNGVAVLLLEDRRLPRVEVGVTVRRGAAGVPVDQAGLAPFTAELMKRGAGNRDALELSAAVDEIGASLSVSAGWDDLSVRVGGLSGDLDLLLEILADVALRPRFEEAEAEKARGQALAALERARDEPGTLAHWKLARALYPEHRYGLPRSGSPETVARLGAGAARRLHDRLFVPSDAIFSAVGDIDPDDLLARAGALFGAWSGDAAPPPGPAAPSRTPKERSIVVVDRPDLGQAKILLGQEGIGRTDPERIPVALLNSALGGSGFSSRLMERLRARDGLTYGVYSTFTLRRTPGPFFVSTSTRVAEARRAIDGILEVLETARTSPPEEEELHEAQMLAVGRFALGLETSDAVMESLVNLEIYGLPRDSLDTYRSRVRAVTPADLAILARSHLDPERLAIVVVGPAGELAGQLEGLGPIEHVAP